VLGFAQVDAPQLGRRERDMRNKAGEGAAAQKKTGEGKKDQGTSAQLTSFIDPSLNWEDLAWFKSITKMPIILKGVQTKEDALKASRAGIRGIVVSNHGGRQLDAARSGIEVLGEVVPALKLANGGSLPQGFEIFVDGGIRRGSDVFKALAMGASAVGIGKPVAYAMSAYGQSGIEAAVLALKTELSNTMRLMGCTTLDSIKPDMIDAAALNDHTAGAPIDYLTRETYAPLPTSVAVHGGSSSAAWNAGATAPTTNAPVAGPGLLAVAGTAMCTGAAGAAIGVTAALRLHKDFR
jgi:L-lactate dehydrogenase (cytochrome)